MAIDVPLTDDLTQPQEIPEPFEKGLNIDKMLEKLKTKKAIYEIDFTPSQDGSEKPFPANLLGRVNLEDEKAFRETLTGFFGLTKEQLSSLEGKTFLVTYTKYGHGHKHQALDFAVNLAHFLKAKVVLVDPMEGLPTRENQHMIGKKGLHGAMQRKDKAGIQAIIDQFSNLQSNAKGLYKYFDQFANYGAVEVAKLAMASAPNSDEAAGAVTDQKTVRFTESLKGNPSLFARTIELVTAIEILLTERSTAAATAGLAAHFGAEAVITAHPNAIRGLTKDVLNWLPPPLRELAEKSLKTILLLIPDTGYTFRSVNQERENSPTAKDKTDAMLLNSPFSIPRIIRERAKWLQNAISVVADHTVGQAFHNNWGAKKENIAPLGTSTDTLSPQEVKDKWNESTFHILMASNGNGTNVDSEMVPAIQQIGEYGADKFFENPYALDFYLANHANKVDKLVDELHKAGLTDDQIEIYNYEADFAAHQPPAWSDKKIHLMYAESDAATSDLKQWLQRKAHLEIRTCGENGLTGATKATLEILTPPGGPNEIFNTIETMRRRVAFAVNWPLNQYWNEPDKGINLKTIIEEIEPGKEINNFPELINFFLADPARARTLAINAYQASDKESNLKMMGLLIRELLAQNSSVPSRDWWVAKLNQWAVARNQQLAQALA